MLELRNISFTYPGNTPLFEDYSLTVGPRERVALVAPSGTGKTSLCRVMAGYEVPQQGCVLVDGKPLCQQKLRSVQLIAQHPEMIVNPRMRMKQVLAEAGNLDVELLDLLGIRTEWLTRYPHELSGGELQRFCIARALAVKPRYVVADEISTMLDAVTQARIWQVLLDWLDANNAGLVFVSHSPALTQHLATRTVCLG